MILNSRITSRANFEAESGWRFKPEGACKGEVCIPLGDVPAEQLDAVAMAEVLGLPVVEESNQNLIAIGPESIGARALTTALAPDVVLPDLDGKPFALSSLRGQKILVYAWAPY
jgi:hypothetical protein